MLPDLTLVDDDPPDLDLRRRLPGGSRFTPGLDLPGADPRRPAVPPPALCFPLEPPPYGAVDPFTRKCFDSAAGHPLHDWPPTDCAPPCVGRAVCDPPSPLAASMAIVLLDTEFLLDDWEALPGGVAHPSQIDFVGAALSLLAENADLVEWAVCVATSWAPDLQHPDPIRACVQEALGGGLSVYLLASLGTHPDGGVPTGGGTDMLVAAALPLPPAGPGVLVPLNIDYWRSATAAYESGGTSGLCATASLAATILHEVLHLCAFGLQALPVGFPTLVWQEGLDLADYARPGFAADADPCWAIQNQAAMNFLYALGRRIPRLAAAVGTCCPKAGDLFFASAEPRGAPTPWVAGPC